MYNTCDLQHNVPNVRFIPLDMSDPPAIILTYQQTKGVNMTQLTESLFSTIVHEYHNGGVKSSYKLDAYTRKEVLAYLIRSTQCNCIVCL
jgi:hypothetical protein